MYMLSGAQKLDVRYQTYKFEVKLACRFAIKRRYGSEDDSSESITWRY